MGETYYVGKGLSQSEIIKFDATHFNGFLDGLYAQPQFLLVGLIDVVLMSLLKFLQGIIKTTVVIFFLRSMGFQQNKIIFTMEEVMTTMKRLI